MAVAVTIQRSEDRAVLLELAGELLDVLDQLGTAMARHIHEQLPELGGLDDAEALEATRRSCHANLREILCMVRGGVQADALLTPFAALDYAGFMRQRGVGLASVLGAYKYGVGMLRALVTEELGARVADDARRQAAIAAADAFVLAYVDGVTARLAGEFGADREDWRPDPSDPDFRRAVSAESARRFRDEMRASGRWDGDGSRRRLAEAEEGLQALTAQIAELAHDETMGGRLARAGTTVRIRLLDEPELSRVLLLDRTPARVVDDSMEPAEIELCPLSVDLDRLWGEDFYLPMAIVKGRVAVEGPVRKFLRVIPIIRGHRSSVDAE